MVTFLQTGFGKHEVAQAPKGPKGTCYSYKKMKLLSAHLPGLGATEQTYAEQYGSEKN
jgi:hypothetical protein